MQPHLTGIDRGEEILAHQENQAHGSGENHAEGSENAPPMA
jgi:hypothetical protein